MVPESAEAGSLCASLPLVERSSVAAVALSSYEVDTLPRSIVELGAHSSSESIAPLPAPPRLGRGGCRIVAHLRGRSNAVDRRTGRIRR